MKYDNQRQDTMSAGFWGMVIGASVATVTLLMMDEQKRKSVKKTLSELRDRIDRVATSLRDKADQLTSQGTDMVEEATDQLEEEADKAQRKARNRQSTS